MRDLSSPIKMKSSSPPPHDQQSFSARARELGSPIKERSLQRKESVDYMVRPLPELSADEQDEDEVDDLHGVDLTK